MGKGTPRHQNITMNWELRTDSKKMQLAIHLQNIYRIYVSEKLEQCLRLQLCRLTLLPMKLVMEIWAHVEWVFKKSTGLSPSSYRKRFGLYFFPYNRSSKNFAEYIAPDEGAENLTAKTTIARPASCLKEPRISWHFFTTSVLGCRPEKHPPFSLSKFENLSHSIDCFSSEDHLFMTNTHHKIICNRFERPV